MNATTDDAAHVVIGDAPLRRDTLVRLARAPSGQLTIGETARARVRAGEQRLAAALARGERVYGVNTGCGALDDQRVDAERSARLQRNLLRSHAAGVGEPMARDAVRAMILARLSTLCRGDSAVRLELVEALGALLQHDVTPWVPTVGSLGVSDLTALAHVGLTLVGEGRARVGDGPFIDAARALEQVGLPPLTLAGRDGLGLINGPSQTVALAALCCADARALIRHSERVAALSLLAFGDAADFLAPALSAHGSAGLRAAAEHARALLDGEPRAPMRDRAALSSRCMPEVAGAARDALSALGLAVDHALDASIDNPLLGETHCTNNAGHMHSQSLAMACDTLRVALGALGSISERRTARLVDGAHCDLPRFLVADASRLGERSGLMIASYTAAALVAELRVRSAPAATCAPPVCGGFEDHGSMSALAARLCREHVAQVQSLVAIELVAAAQGFDLAHRLRPAPPRLSPALAALVSALRDHVPFCDGDDRVVADDIAAARLVLHFGHETL